MSISIDGTSLVFDGTVTITNFTDTTTGVATLMLTPVGGLGSLPALAVGESGLPPVFDTVTLHEVAPGTTLPSSTFTLVSPGGAGVASHYNVDLYVHSGATGSPGPSTTISLAPDVEGTLTDGYILVYNTTDTKWKISAQKVGDLYYPSTISSTSGNSSTRTLCSFTVPAQPFDWRPTAWGQCIVSGTVNTRVDLVARVNDATTGDVFAKGFGLAGVTDRAYVIPAIPPGSASSYAKVAAGSSATIYLQAIQQNGGTTDSWTTDNSTTTFELKVNPVQ